MSKTVEQIRNEILANKKPEACETYQNANGICSKCGWEREAHVPYSERQAHAQLSSICEMVANLTREGAARNYVADKDCAELSKLIAGADLNDNVAWDENSDVETMRDDVAQLIEDETLEPSDFEWDEDDARQTIQDDALEVQVRGDWHNPGDEDASKPSEFYILLCTGGPAVRIMGELNSHGEPDRAWIEHQDWGTPWTHLCGLDSDQTEALLTYCQQFFFGE